ncbi:MAG: phosphoribosyl-AMP cyclohydrolase [Terriglobia bacterium]
MELKFDAGLIPAIVQDAKSGRVLMLGYMNGAAWEKTLGSGYVTFYSRSRNKLWTKGEESGHRLAVREVRVDCDADALLVRAELTGPGCCHEGYESCFYRRLTPGGDAEIADPQQFDPAAVYKQKL